MKKSEKYFQLFESKLKKYSSREVVKIFANFDRNYFREDKKEPVTRIFGSGIYSQKLIIEPWIFPEIVFNSAKYNDYKSNITESQAWELYGLYHNFATALKDEYADDNYKNSNDNILPPLVYGYMQEQAIYQVSFYLFVNRFNRNFYLLKDIMFDSKNLEMIVKEKLQIDLKTYIKYLSFITLLSISFPILNNDEVLKYIDDKDLYLKIIEDMSVSYNDCRPDFNEFANKDIFKIRPILRTSFDEYIVPSIHTMFYNYGDKLYWLLKDQFRGRGTFVDKFGEVFENYINEILIKQYNQNYVEKIPTVENEKSADFKIETPNYTILIEVKAGVARADAKQAALNRESLNFFIENNIIDAMKQLDASARKFKSDKKVICIILNFDQMYTEDSLLFDISTLYKPQNYNVESLLLFGIDSFETFIYNYDSVDKLENLFDNYKDKSLKVHQIIENCDAIKDYFYEDIFYKETDAFIDVLKLSKMYHDKNQKMIKKSKVCRKIKNEKSKKDFACCLHKK